MSQRRAAEAVLPSPSMLRSGVWTSPMSSRLVRMSFLYAATCTALTALPGAARQRWKASTARLHCLYTQCTSPAW